MGTVILLLVAAAGVVLVLGPLFGKMPVAEPDEAPLPGPSDDSALQEDVATGKLTAEEISAEEEPR